MSEYAPSTGNVRVAYVTGAGGDHGIDRDEASAEFDRWLAAHDAKVTAETAEQIAKALVEHAYYQIAMERSLTFTPTGPTSAQVPEHWRAQAEDRAQPWLDIARDLGGEHRG